MTYPSQPGYQPTPPYGQSQPPQQNNLWLIGGAILVVLIIIMTVILLVVQRTAGAGSSQNGDGATTGAENSETDTDSDGDTDEDTDDGYTGEATTMTAEACDVFDMTKFEEAYGAYEPDNTYRSASSSNGLEQLSCAFYNDDYMSVTIYMTDYEDASDVVSWVESDADYYTADEGYEFSEYTELGDAGSLYTKADSGLGTHTINLHLAFGSLDLKLYTTLFDDEDIDEAAALAVLEDYAAQCEVLFADYM